MNTLLLLDPKLTFGENDHPFCETGFTVISKRINCLMDTGFSLGFAFSNHSINKFRYTNGYVVAMLLGNGIPTRGMAFIVDLWVKHGNDQRLLGQTSVVFMEKQGEPLIGIETLRLFGPMTINWSEKTIVSAL